MSAHFWSLADFSTYLLRSKLYRTITILRGATQQLDFMWTTKFMPERPQSESRKRWSLRPRLLSHNTSLSLRFVRVKRRLDPIGYHQIVLRPEHNGSYAQWSKGWIGSLSTIHQPTTICAHCQVLNLSHLCRHLIPHNKYSGYSAYPSNEDYLKSYEDLIKSKSTRQYFFNSRQQRAKMGPQLIFGNRYIGHERCGLQGRLERLIFTTTS